MARNFKIQTSGTDHTVFIDLIGDFDGSSALELLNLLREKIFTRNKGAFVNTNGLKNIHPFGKSVFTRNFPTIAPGSVIFTGRYAHDFAPLDGRISQSAGRGADKMDQGGLVAGGE